MARVLWPVRSMATRSGTLARIKLSGGGAAAIVEEASGHASRLTGGAPRRAPAADGDAVAVEEQRAVGVAARPPSREGLGNGLRDRENPPHQRLRAGGREPDDAAGLVDLVPGEAEDLVLAPVPEHRPRPDRHTLARQSKTEPRAGEQIAGRPPQSAADVDVQLDDVGQQRRESAVHGRAGRERACDLPVAEEFQERTQAIRQPDTEGQRVHDERVTIRLSGGRLPRSPAVVAKRQSGPELVGERKEERRVGAVA